MNRRLARVLICSFATLSVAGAAAAQTEPPDAPQQIERLRRDQDEILRKAGRLCDFMDRLRQRYEREGKQEQAELLRQGLHHLEQAGLLRDVASVRDDLVASALSDAVRKQQEVVDDIERLLNILLQRHSIENIDEQIQQTTELAGRVRDLERRQARLAEQTRAATERQATPAEQALEQQLQQLARDQAAEAQRNARDAGARRPFLESALQAVKDLLREQERVERRMAAEDSGAADADRERAFDLGELIAHARNLATDVRDQQRQTELQATAERLQQALRDGNQGGAQQARDELEARLQQAPDRRDLAPSPQQLEAGIGGDQDWEALRELAKAAPTGATPAERDQLQQLADRTREVTTRREQIARGDNARAAEELAAATSKVGDRLQPEPEPKPESAAAAARQAAADLQQAAAAVQAGDSGKAQEQVQSALRSLEEARRRQHEQNPDAERLARQMAAAADSTERELRNAPAAEDAERAAADSLARAEEALRAAAGRLGEQPDGSPRPRPDEPAKARLADSRQGLEQARQTLEDALQQAGADRQAGMEAAAERQQQLQKRAEQLRQDLQQTRKEGGINEPQQAKADAAMQAAQQAMDAAEQALQSGQQATAGQQQRSAAQALQQAQQALRQERSPGPEQQQAMRDLANDQQAIEDEILRLAEEAKQRKNPEARRALEDAAEAARRARTGMQQGERDDTEQQQQRARERLDDAARELEEERDRYLDQRQEELLFRIKEELLAFLEKQQPITTETEALHKAAAADGLSRPARRKLNQFAEEEQSLAVRLKSIVDALTEEGNLVYRTVLTANHDDLQEVGRRLAGRNPDPSSYTTMLQHDVERRTKDLLEALAREQQRREQERKEQQQQQQGQNRFNPQRQKLVTLIAELEMLKQLEHDTARATDDLRSLVELRTGDDVSEAELALVERLLHRHAEVTTLFQKIKAGVDEAMQAMQGEDQEQPEGHGRGR